MLLPLLAATNLWVFGIRYFDSDRDTAEMMSVVGRAAACGYNGLVLGTGRLYTGDWWDDPAAIRTRLCTRRPDETGVESGVMAPERLVRIKKLQSFAVTKGVELIPLVWSVGYNSMKDVDPGFAAVRRAQTPRGMTGPRTLPELAGTCAGEAHTVVRRATIATEPHGTYRLTGEYATDDIYYADPAHGGWGCGVRMVAYAADGLRELDFIAPKGGMTRGWTPFTLDFNAGTNTEVTLALGKFWEDTPMKGTCRFRNVRLAPREASAEWEPILFGGVQSSACLTNPKLFEYFRKSAADIREAIAPKTWFLSMDEVRVRCECDRCRASKTSFAERLKRVLRAQYDAIRAVAPGATVVCWSDMLDPGHSAPAPDVVDALPKDVVIALWHGGRKTESAAFFRSRGYRVLGAGFYDKTDAAATAADAKAWREVADFGTMYTTWAGTNSCATGDYRFLEVFSKCIH